MLFINNRDYAIYLFLIYSTTIVVSLASFKFLLDDICGKTMGHSVGPGFGFHFMKGTLGEYY